MKTWVVIHGGKWPVGGCTLVTAKDKDQATQLVLDELARDGPAHQNTIDWDWFLAETQEARAVNILNGDY